MAPERRWVQPPQERAQQPPSVGLRCPDTPLGRARARRGWSQAKAVRALLLAARHQGWTVAAEDALKVMLHRWEHQQHRPGRMYQALLSTVYQATPEELGFTTPPPAARTETVSPQSSEAQDLRDQVAALEGLVRELSNLLLTVGNGGVR